MKFSKAVLCTGAYILLDNLVQNGVEHIFGYPGGAILPIYDELFYWEKTNILKHILVRHEQSAAHAADAYARSTNKVGVCFATSGPGATNLVTGIATARMDSIPLIVITGQVTRSFIGTDAFQETDIFGITLPLVKHSYTVRNTENLSAVLSEAFFIAQNGRPGPVLIDIPKDIGLEEIEHYLYTPISKFFAEPHYRMTTVVSKNIVQKLYEYIIHSYQPLFYAGGGILRANAFKSLTQFAKIFQIPLTTTLMGKSAINELDYLSLGMLGMHGTPSANFAVSDCDLLLALGTRFDDRVTGKLEEFACEAEVIHIDIDPAEISKNRSPQLGIIGDVRKNFLLCLKELRKVKNLEKNQTKNWLKRIEKWRKLYSLLALENQAVLVSPQCAIYLAGKAFSNAFISTDVGQHQMWSAQLINCQPKKWISSSGLGTMGFGLPAAIGAKIANPWSEVLCISGDSSFQMNIQELGTLSQYTLPITCLIINNGWQGMVRQWQESFYGNRFSNSYMKNGMPNFSDIAKSYGILGFTIVPTYNLESKLILQLIGGKRKETPFFQIIRSLKGLEKFFTQLKKNSDSLAIIIDIKVIEEENCYPMVSPGKSNSQMLGLVKILKE